MEAYRGGWVEAVASDAVRIAECALMGVGVDVVVDACACVLDPCEETKVGTAPPETEAAPASALTAAGVIASVRPPEVDRC